VVRTIIREHGEPTAQRKGKGAGARRTYGERLPGTPPTGMWTACGGTCRAQVWLSTSRAGLETILGATKGAEGASILKDCDVYPPGA